LREELVVLDEKLLALVPLSDDHSRAVHIVGFPAREKELFVGIRAKQVADRAVNHVLIDSMARFVTVHPYYPRFHSFYLALVHTETPFKVSVVRSFLDF